MRSFNDFEQSNQAIKSNFMCTVVNWASEYIKNHIVTMIDFVDWLSLK